MRREGELAMKILVLGAGAIGGYFGGRLAQAGADVTFLVRPARLEALRASGLTIESPLGHFNGPVATALASELRPDFDLVLLTCKAYDLDSSLEAIAGGMGMHTVIVPLLNGLAHYDVIDARFGRHRVMGGTCMIDSTLTADGVVRHSGTLQRMVVGERDGAASPRLDAFSADLSRTAIDWSVSDNITQTLWDKLVFLAALASATCLFRGTVREIVASPGGREVMARALDANLEIARRAGFPCGQPAIDFARGRLTHPDGGWSASMLRDLEAGGRVEADHIVGWMLHKARVYGADDTVLSMAFTHLKTYEQRRDAGRLPHL